MGRRMRFYVERSPAGGYQVKVRGSHAPISRHDTEQEAEARRDAYARGAAAHATERLTLRDGSVVIVRPLEQDDRPLVQAVFDRMGEEARYRRFLGYKKRLSARDLETLTAVDHHRHEAIVALDAETGEALGMARMLQERSRPDTAEASVAVVDAWQGRGLGGMLMDRVVRRAREEGVRRFTAVLLTRNVAMLHLFERVGAVRVVSRYGDTLEFEVALPFDTGAAHADLFQLPRPVRGRRRRRARQLRRQPLPAGPHQGRLRPGQPPRASLETTCRTGPHLLPGAVFLALRKAPRFPPRRRRSQRPLCLRRPRPCPRDRPRPQPATVRSPAARATRAADRRLDQQAQHEGGRSLKPNADRLIRLDRLRPCEHDVCPDLLVSSRLMTRRTWETESSHGSGRMRHLGS